MRVQRLSRVRSPRRDDGGAVAVTVALLMLVLVGVGAFTIDFGVSYVSTRQLQVASDSAALAAASKYGELIGTCAELTANSAARTSVQTAVDAYRTQNRADSTGSITSVACSPNNKSL